MLLSTLEKIKMHVENIIKQFNLKQPNNNYLDYTLSPIKVFIGWIPPEQKDTTVDMSLLTEKNIPCLVIGLDEVIDGEDTSIKVKITAVVFDDGFNNNGEFNVDFNGYINLINTLDKLRAGLLIQKIIDDYIKIDDTIKTRLYEQQPYPYWYGYISFNITTNTYPHLTYTEYL